MVGSIADKFYLPIEELLLQYYQAVNDGDQGYTILDEVVQTNQFRLFLEHPKECLSKSMFLIAPRRKSSYFSLWDNVDSIPMFSLEYERVSLFLGLDDATFALFLKHEDNLARHFDLHLNWNAPAIQFAVAKYFAERHALVRFLSIMLHSQNMLRVDNFVRNELSPSFVDALLQLLQFDVSQIKEIHHTPHSTYLSPYFETEILLIQSILLCLVRHFPFSAGQIASFLRESRRCEEYGFQPIVNMQYLFIVVLYLSSPSAFKAYVMNEENMSLMRQLNDTPFWHIPSLSQVLECFSNLASIDDTWNDVDWVLQTLFHRDVDSVDVINTATPLIIQLLQYQRISSVYSLFLDQVIMFLPSSYYAMLSFLSAAMKQYHYDFILPRITEICSLGMPFEEVENESKSEAILEFNTFLLSLSLPSIQELQMEIVKNLNLDEMNDSLLPILTIITSKGYVLDEQHINQLLNNPTNSANYGNLVYTLLHHRIISAESTRNIIPELLASELSDVQLTAVKICFESWKQTNHIDIFEVYYLLAPFMVLLKGDEKQVYEVLQGFHEVMNIPELVKLDELLSLMDPVMDLRSEHYSVRNHRLALTILLVYIQERKCMVDFPKWKEQVDVICELQKQSLRDVKEWKDVSALLVSICRSPNYLGQNKGYVLSRLA